MSEPATPQALLEGLPPFEEEAHYRDGWAVTRFVPGERLELAVDRSELARRLRRLLFALLVPLLLGGALLAITLAEGGAPGWVTYPLLALCALVLLLGIPALGRALRRLSGGVQLSVDAQAERAQGFPAASSSLSGTWGDFQARARQVPFAQLERVELCVFRHPADGRHAAEARLGLRLRDGSTLEGPEAAEEDAAWEDARDRLLPLARELACLARVPLRVEYRWRDEHTELSPEQLGGPSA